MYRHSKKLRSQFENSRLSAHDSEPLTVHDFWLLLRLQYNTIVYLDT